MFSFFCVVWLRTSRKLCFKKFREIFINNILSDANNAKNANDEKMHIVNI